MAEKTQKTAAGMRLKMHLLYGDEPHKHNKNHLQFSFNPRKEMQETVNGYQASWELAEGHEHWTSKKIQEFKARKTRKRLDKGRFH